MTDTPKDDVPTAVEAAVAALNAQRDVMLQKHDALNEKIDDLASQADKIARDINAMDAAICVLLGKNPPSKRIPKPSEYGLQSIPVRILSMVVAAGDKGITSVACIEAMPDAAPVSVRSALSGLRKKGLISKRKTWGSPFLATKKGILRVEEQAAEQQGGSDDNEDIDDRGS